MEELKKALADANVTVVKEDGVMDLIPVKVEEYKQLVRQAELLKIFYALIKNAPTYKVEGIVDAFADLIRGNTEDA